jgi:hypothetical protein
MNISWLSKHTTGKLWDMDSTRTFGIGKMVFMLDHYHPK